VCCLAARRATYGPYRLLLDGKFRRAKNGPSQMRRPWLTYAYNVESINTKYGDIQSLVQPVQDNGAHVLQWPLRQLN